MSSRCAGDPEANRTEQTLAAQQLSVAASVPRETLRGLVQQTSPTTHGQWGCRGLVSSMGLLEAYRQPVYPWQLERQESGELRQQRHHEGLLPHERHPGGGRHMQEECTLPRTRRGAHTSARQGLVVLEGSNSLLNPCLMRNMAEWDGLGCLPVHQGPRPHSALRYTKCRCEIG